MKKCPTCQSIVDDDDTCPICQTSLIYEPSAHTDDEKIVWNRYYVMYLLKTLAFSVLCFLFCIIRVIGWREELDSLCVPIVLFSALSLFLGLTDRRMPASAAVFYKKEGYRFSMVLGKYLSAITAVILATIPMWL